MSTALRHFPLPPAAGDTPVMAWDGTKFVASTALSVVSLTLSGALTAASSAVSGAMTAASATLSGALTAASAAITGQAAVGSLSITDGGDITLGTGTGTKLGTSTSQKLGHFGVAPVVQPTGTTDLRQSLINLGLYASGGASPLNLNGGALTAGSVTNSALTSGRAPYATTSGLMKDDASYTFDDTAKRLKAALNLPRTTVSDAIATIATGDCYLAQTGSMSASRVVTLPSASAVAAGAIVAIADESGSVTAANTIVVTRAGSDTIDGASTLSLTYAYGRVVLVSDGTSKWKVLVAPLVDIQVFLASGTWNKPSWASSVTVQIIGGGGAGGSGRRGADGTVRCGGGGGGSGGCIERTFSAALLGSTEAVTVGAAATGGPAITVDDTSGTAGGNGTLNQFSASAYLRVNGGTGGGGGTAATGTAGSGGITGGGANGAAASTTGLIGANGGQMSTATAGAASGGGITTGNATSNGGVGGTGMQTAGGTAGVADGGAIGGTAADATIIALIGGAGAGGGGSSRTTAAGAGGVGAKYGAGGGGGGASSNGNNSGAGGNGAPGICIVISS